MASTTLAVDVCITLILTLLLLRRYSNLRHFSSQLVSFFNRDNYAVTFVTLIAWFFSASIVLILPLDVSSTFYWDCVRRWFCSQPGNADANGCQTDDIFLNETAQQQCKDNASCSCSLPWSYISLKALPTFWAFVYWTLQLLTW
eukprot:gene207-3592_t